MGKNNNHKWCFIINPAAGGGLVGKQWPKLKNQLNAAGIDFHSVFTERAFHAPELVTSAIAEGFRYIVAVGGDGTAHETINGICSQKICPSEEITFSLLPIGTGNDWVKTHRIPKKFSKWLAYFKDGKTTYQDIGSLTYHCRGEEKHRYFLNVAGLSYDGYVVKKTSEQSARLPSAIHYLWATVRHLFSFRIPPAEIIFSKKKLSGKFYTINVGICKYSGGGMQLVPHARTDDGFLALTIAREIPKFMVILISPLFYLGKIDWHPKASLFRTKMVKINPSSDMPVYVEADGEYLGEAPVEVEILKRKLKILVPK